MPIARDAAVRAVRAALRAERVATALVSVAFVSNARMAALNLRHVGHRGPTDVIAFGFSRANVSDPDSTGVALNSIQRIIDETGLTILPLAHVAKAEGSFTQKGAGEWEDAADALIRIDRKEEGALRTVTLTKQSDEADGLAFGFELEKR